MTSKEQLQKIGYTIIDDVFDTQEIDSIIQLIDSADNSRIAFRKSKDLFAIRQFLKEIPGANNHIITDKLRSLIESVVGKNHFIIKSIYFDKPEESNWFVSYHQDLIISVDKKVALEGYNSWTSKEGYFGVQPPLEVLNSIYTLRIHLDETDSGNGALKVITRSHSKGIYRPETIDWGTEYEEECCVQKGGVMFMRPLLLHSSTRSKSGKKRRVIHLELSNIELPDGIGWAEKILF